MVVVSACMSGTRGSGVMSSTGDVLEMSVVRGVGGVCDMCMCLARGHFIYRTVVLCLDSLCRWQVWVSVYCAWRIPAHPRCTQCSILLQFCEQQRQPSSGSSWPACPQKR